MQTLLHDAMSRKPRSRSSRRPDTSLCCSRSLTRQYKDPEKKSGTYYQLSYTRQMKSRTEYVARDYLPEVRREIRNYKRFRALTIEWVDLSIEQSRLMMKRASRRQ